MSHIKTEFKATAFYHMIAGVIIIALFAMSIMAHGTVDIGSILLLILGALFIYTGYQMRTANRFFVIIAIVLNLIQVCSFALSNFSYECLLGPYCTIDFLSGSMSAGMDVALGFSYSSLTEHIGSSFRINIIALALAAYLLDQLRFIPKEQKVNEQILDTQ